MSIFDKIDHWVLRFNIWLRKEEIEKIRLMNRIMIIEEENKRLSSAIRDIATKNNKHLEDFHLKDFPPTSFSYVTHPGWEYISSYGQYTRSNIVKSAYFDINVPESMRKDR